MTDMPLPRRAIVTCGPSITPIDAVRRITNFSTGELGVRLTESLSEHGWEVHCFKGTAATYRNPEGEGVELHSFSTNANLGEGLAALPEPETVAVVFHTAALGDYEVESIQTMDGSPLEARKVSSHLPGLRLHLRPAPKLLPKLGALFPRARIVGWKFELEGDRESAIETARLQIQVNHTALSVVNGEAFGTGFGILDPAGDCELLETRSELCQRLAVWAGGLEGLEKRVGDGFGDAGSAVDSLAETGNP